MKNILEHARRALSDDLKERFDRQINDHMDKYVHLGIKHDDARRSAAAKIIQAWKKHGTKGRDRKYWDLDRNAVKSIKRNMKKHGERIVESYKIVTEAWDDAFGAGIAGAAIGAGIGILGGMIYDYFKTNRKIYKMAEIIKEKYIKEHKDDYTNKQCEQEAQAYISERVVQINELTQLIQEKQEQLHDLSQELSMTRLGQMDKGEIERKRWLQRKLQNEIKTLQTARAKCKSEMITMRTYLMTKKWSNIRLLLVMRDAEEYAADYISKNTSDVGKVIGAFAGLGLGALAAVIFSIKA